MLLYIGLVAFALVRYSVFYCCVRRFKVIIVLLYLSSNGFTIARELIMSNVGGRKICCNFRKNLHLWKPVTWKS